MISEAEAQRLHELIGGALADVEQTYGHAMDEGLFDCPACGAYRPFASGR